MVMDVRCVIFLTVVFSFVTWSYSVTWRRNSWVRGVFGCEV